MYLIGSDRELLPDCLVPALEQLDSSRERFESLKRLVFEEYKLDKTGLVEDPTLTFSPTDAPERILISIGPNIGIGDEMMYFALAQAMKARWPRVVITVFSCNDTLWDACPYVDQREYYPEEPLIPFSRAEAFLKSDHSLVLFADFNCAPMYRMLEGYSAIPRFVYCDLGARIARIVDQTRRAIHEITLQGVLHVYDLLSVLIQRLGLTESSSLASNNAAPTSSGIQNRPCKLFLNPFSTKNYRSIDPEWWANSLDSIGNIHAISVDIFQGLTHGSYDYARQIDKAIHSPYISKSELCFPRGVTLCGTLKRALSCDLVFGVDTFTSHIGVIQPLPTVTAYLNRHDEAWRVPRSGSMAFPFSSNPIEVGLFIAALLTSPTERVRIATKELLHVTWSWKRFLEAPEFPQKLSSFLQSVLQAIRKCEAVDPHFQALVREDLILPSLGFLLNSPTANRARSSWEEKEIQVRVFNEWRHSNGLHYAAHLADGMIPGMVK